MTSKEIRERLKAIGYNSRQVSVRERPLSLNWAFDLTIRDPSVNYHKVKALADSIKSIDYCEASGEVLSGANVYTHVKIAPEVGKIWCKKWAWLIEGAKDQFQQSIGTRIGRFVFFLNQWGEMTAWDKQGDIRLKNVYRSINALALDLFIAEQEEEIKEPVC